MTPLFIGLGHYSRAGKDSFARAFKSFIEDLSSLCVREVSFASKLKEVCHALYGWAGLHSEEYYNDPAHEHERNCPLWLLNGLTPVEIWVRFGTSAVRNNVYDRTWIDCLLNRAWTEDIVVIRDVRFLNEVEAIWAHGGIVWKIERPGVHPKDTAADQALVSFDKWDHVWSAENMRELELNAARAACMIIKELHEHESLRNWASTDGRTVSPAGAGNNPEARSLAQRRFS